MTGKRAWRIVLGLAVLIVIGIAVLFIADAGDVEPITPVAMTPEAKAAQIEHGRYLAVAGDCVACHTRPGGEPFAGGLAFLTPFGKIYSPNITPDKKTGIGDWSATDIYRALHLGKDPHKANLYPAFSYPYYTKVSRQDAADMAAYLQALTPVSYTPPKNEMKFPFNIRFLVKGWNLLHFRPGHFKPDPSKSAEWNRGAYLVEGLGHCGACHTPKNSLLGDKGKQALQGGLIEDWFASDITNNAQTGLGKWSEEEIAQFLKTGSNVHAIAYGTMVEVITNSTSQMTDADLKAIAVYLKSVPGAPKQPAPPKPAAAMMASGEAIYAKECGDCHIEDGSGVPELYTPLAGNHNLNVTDPTSTIRIILNGQENAFSGEGMPGYAKLSDKEIAAVATYIRNSFGNAAPEVTEAEVKRLRGLTVKPKAKAAEYRLSSDHPRFRGG